MALSKGLLVFGGTVATIFLAKDLRQELDPLAGCWHVSTVTENGKRAKRDPFIRVFLDVTASRHASVAYYWTCGARGETFTEGKMVRDRDTWLLYEENWATKERAAFPNGELHCLQNGDIGFAFPSTSGTIWLEFTREHNAETLFDIVGWH